MERVSMYENSVLEAIEKIKTLLQHRGKFYKSALSVSETMLQYQAKCGKAMQKKIQKLRTSYLDTVSLLVDFLDHKDEYTKGHCQRVTRYTVAIGRAMELEEREMLNLELAALLHDIGKLGVPDEIINKEGKLTPQEYEIVKTHPAVGYELIKEISFLDISSFILLQHHERVDGKGYPFGLREGQIDLKAKIISVADAYDAMTSSRPYRKQGLTKEQAIEQLQLCVGSQFDKEIVDVFVKWLKSGEAA